MKTKQAFAVISLAFLLTVGCMPEKPFIEAVQLSENEEGLLRAVGVERYFAFDLDLSQVDFLKLEYRVDYYENGNLVDEPFFAGGISLDMVEQKRQRLLWSQIRSGSIDEVWMISFAGGRTTQQVSLVQEMQGMTWSYNEMVQTVAPGDEIMLAAIVGTNTSELRCPSIIFNPEGGVEALKEFDVAYVLTLVFHEDLNHN